MDVRTRPLRPMSIGRTLRSGWETSDLQDVPDAVRISPVAPDGGDPPQVDRIRHPQRPLPDTRTQHLVTTLFRGNHTIAFLTISERLTETAVYNAIQVARGQGYNIVARPGPPTTFRFHPTEPRS